MDHHSAMTKLEEERL